MNTIKATTATLNMSETIPLHETCRHPVDPDDPRRRPRRPICFECSRVILNQAVNSIERRFFDLVWHSNFDIGQHYYEALEVAFALGRHDELELAVWMMAGECICDHPKLFVASDKDELVVATMKAILTDSNFDYTTQDARAFVRQRALVLDMQRTSLKRGRRPSNASDSGSIQLPTDEEILATELSTMSIDDTMSVD